MKNIFQKLYIWSKKIHRLAMWITIVLSILMGSTGLLLEAEISGQRSGLRSLFNMKAVRSLHGATGKWLVLALSIMIMTGLVMWAYPLWIKRQTQSRDQST